MPSELGAGQAWRGQDCLYSGGFFADRDPASIRSLRPAAPGGGGATVRTRESHKKTAITLRSSRFLRSPARVRLPVAIILIAPSSPPTALLDASMRRVLASARIRASGSNPASTNHRGILSGFRATKRKSAPIGALFLLVPPPPGFEPGTQWLTGEHSITLHYYRLSLFVIIASTCVVFNSMGWQAFL